MLSRRWGLALVIVGGMTAMAAVFAVSQLPVIGAGGLLHPARARVLRAARFFLVGSARQPPARRAGLSGAARVYPWPD